MSSAEESDLPRRVGPFRIGGVLGRGGMGVVYRGETAAGRPAAIKVLLAQTDMQIFHARFEREGSIRIAHPNVVQILDVGTDPTAGPYIAFELLEGETLRQRARRQALTYAQAVDAIQQACRGLEAAHRKGIIHRDLKPSNLFLTTDGDVKLLDFGVAGVAEAPTELTADQVIGTPAYLAPEQARAESDLDGRADVWALGVVLYELLAGRKPFIGDSPMALMMKIILDPPPPLLQHNPAAPQSLVRIVDRCLEKERGDRFAGPEALRRAVQAIDDLPDGRCPTHRRAIRKSSRALLTVSSKRTTSGSFPPDERRLVAAVAIDRPRDPAMARRVLEEHGAFFVHLLGGRSVGIFGQESWIGDELHRAAEAGLAIVGTAKSIAIGAGRASSQGQRIQGALFRSLEAALRERGIQPGIRVLENAAPALRDAFELSPAGASLFTIEGRREATGVRDAQGELVGRTPEMARLDQLVEQATAGFTTAAVVSGPPGVGKSRLKLELVRALDELGATVLTAEGTPRGQHGALSLLSTALRRHGGLTEPRPTTADDSDSTVIDQGIAVVHDLCRSAFQSESNEHTAFIGELVGVKMPSTPALEAAREDPQLMADRLQLAAKEWLSGRSQDSLVVLLADDLQWADDASLELLRDFVDETRDAFCFVCAFTRPELEERFPQYLQLEGGSFLDLRGLTGLDVITLAEATASRPLPKELTRDLARHTEGNPLFIREIISALNESSTDETPSDLPLPLTVEGAVQSRLDQLPDRERDLCRKMAVFGRGVTEEELSSLGVEGASNLLGALTKRQLIGGTRGARGRRELAFRTPLTAEVAYRGLDEQQRVSLHRTVASLLHARKSGGYEAGEIGLHWERGGEPTRAAESYAEAAITASERGDSASVLELSDRALALEPPPRLRFRIAMVRAEAFRFTGDRNAQSEALSVAVDLARSTPDLARALVEQAVVLSRTGRSTEARMVIERAATAARGLGDPSVLAYVLGRRANILTHDGDLDEADASLVEAVLLAPVDAPLLQGFIAEWRALLANARGDLGAQVDAFQDAARHFNEAGDMRRAAGAETNGADALNRVGAWTDAESALRTAARHCQRVGNRLIEGYAQINLAYALIRQDRLDEAEAHLEAAEQLGERNSDLRLRLYCDVYRARMHLRTTPVQPKPAIVLVRSVAERASGQGLRGVEIAARVVLSRALLVCGEKEEALSVVSDAMSLRDQQGGAEEDESSLYLAFADALRALGRDEEAEGIRAQGEARLLAVAQRIGSEEMRRGLLENVPENRALLGKASLKEPSDIVE